MFCVNKLSYFAKRFQLIARGRLIGSSVRTLCTTSALLHFQTPDQFFTEISDNDPTVNDFKKVFSDIIQPETGGRKAFVIQPFIKWGPLKKRDTTPELQMQESVSLINTLDSWTVEGKEIVSLYTFDASNFFGSGKLDELKSKICSNRKVTALFISVNMLNPAQHMFLEEFFSVPVYDRYLIVMQIFREHAISPEAKLQISLAELPYLYSRMNHFHSLSLARVGKSASLISGTSIHAPEDSRKLTLHKYESKLRNAAEKLHKHREKSRIRRKTLNHPVVAVVGYTNAGKTSLIRMLTKSNKLVPRNYLFATLDVTFHMGQLPCSLKVFYVDTIGFISDIPTHLIEPFKVTLTDAMNADLIVHVQDVSNPDWCFQRDRVTETLETLNIEESLLHHVIPVANKIDLLPQDHKLIIPSNTFQISCTNGYGVEALKFQIQDEIIKITGRIHLVIRVKSGGDEHLWLKSEAAVVDVQVDKKNANYSLLSIIVTENVLDKFKRNFIRDYVKK